MNELYEKEFINSAVKLDALMEANGQIASVAKRITEECDKEQILFLLSEIKKVEDSRNNRKEIIIMAQHVNDAFLKYLGYKTYHEICNADSEIEEDHKTLPELIDELDKLVGLEKVKEQVKDLIAFQMVNKRRIAVGLHETKRTMHLAFIGNPGTGKTTVARIVGRIYKELGLLSKGHFIEASRTDLIAGYQGQTALKVKDLVGRAKGGVLFIDEAYSITENEHTDSYGRECLTELTKALEDYRDDLVVIVAGYTEPMKKFFASNPGLESRFNTFIEFGDYDGNQLMVIFENMCHENDYKLDSEAQNEVYAFFKKAVEEKDETFSNGRLARNLYEKMVMAHARRVVDISDCTKEILSTFVKADYDSVKNELFS